MPENQTSSLYILDALGKPVPEPDIEKWTKWYENIDHRMVAEDTIGESNISTIFLGIDPSGISRRTSRIPMLWETMVFGGPLDQEQWRCGGSREEAKAMHASAVAEVKARRRSHATDP